MLPDAMGLELRHHGKSSTEALYSQGGTKDRKQLETGDWKHREVPSLISVVGWPALLCGFCPDSWTSSQHGSSSPRDRNWKPPVPSALYPGLTAVTSIILCRSSSHRDQVQRKGLSLQFLIGKMSKNIRAIF